MSATAPAQYEVHPLDEDEKIFGILNTIERKFEINQNFKGPWCTEDKNLAEAVCELMNKETVG